MNPKQVVQALIELEKRVSDLEKAAKPVEKKTRQKKVKEEKPEEIK